ncbi:hypothetical protein DFH07DRAFT_1012338 [Mycena maculata]|uniref:Uncharacterized protein n=1 Tax=Mycena maculata TaxID=230809 RepID=A0AAD7HCX2_9AGAR|nr:hypothetical protein DFH07DRAFT_1012338 [Mycena maculata]
MARSRHKSRQLVEEPWLRTCTDFEEGNPLVVTFTNAVATLVSLSGSTIVTSEQPLNVTLTPRALSRSRQNVWGIWYSNTPHGVTAENVTSLTFVSHSPQHASRMLKIMQKGCLSRVQFGPTALNACQIVVILDGPQQHRKWGKKSEKIVGALEGIELRRINPKVIDSALIAERLGY